MGDPREHGASDPMRRWPSSNAPVSSTNPRSMASTHRSPTWRRNSAGAVLPGQHDADGSRGRPHHQSQVRPGMVSGIYRIGGIAALIADADRYLLATFYQENLKYVRPGQPVEVAFDLYPGRSSPARSTASGGARGGTVSAKRRDSKIPAAASQRPPGPVRGEDHPGRSGPVEVSHRRARLRRHLHRR